MFCPLTFWGLFYGFKPPCDPTCISVWWKNLPRVLFSESGTQGILKICATCQEKKEHSKCSGAAEHHKPFEFSALSSQEHLSSNKHSRFAAGFTVVWHGHNSLLSSSGLVVIYIIKYMKGQKSDREGAEIPEPLRNAALSFLTSSTSRSCFLNYHSEFLNARGCKSSGGRRKRDIEKMWSAQTQFYVSYAGWPAALVEEMGWPASSSLSFVPDPRKSFLSGHSSCWISAEGI